MTPTARALAECRRLGWECGVVERWIPHVRRRVDLFGFIDLIAIDADVTYGIQVTTGSNHAERRRKIRESPLALAWLRSPHRRIEVWSYSKKKIKRGGVAYRYELRRENMTQVVAVVGGSGGPPGGRRPEGEATGRR
jgi:hypothetical protein